MNTMFWESLKNDAVKCRLCPHNCRIESGKSGICKVRHNRKGSLSTLLNNGVSSVALDPIEKKPLYHFFPSSKILSVGSLGCNFSCPFCQNHSISKPAKITEEKAQSISSDQLLSLALKYVPEGNIGVAYTYNEPTVWYEFVLESAEKIHKSGLKNVLVTNGYMNIPPLSLLLPYIDAFNIDIKSINPDFYKKYCSGKLKNVLEFCKYASKGALIEITNLVIPTLNDSDDDFRKLSSWIARNLGSETPLHLSAYRPCYKMRIEPTPVETLIRAQEIASKKLNYVYIGNVNINGFADTHCPECGNLLIKRDTYTVKRNFLGLSLCSECKRVIDGAECKV